ncbi:MAG TPA: hypothetical protein VGN07_15960 [Steroidobacteraceae bacterium]|jgi:hypothetical protein
MSTIVHEHIVESPALQGLKISWGGIWGGVLVGMGTLLLLSALGVAVGISAVDPSDTRAASIGTATALWTGVSLLVALFLGGMAATRLGMIFDRTAGIMEGALVWVLSLLIILYLAGSGVSLLAGGVSGLFGGAAKVVGTAAGNSTDLTSGSVDDMIARLDDPQTARTLASVTGMPENEVRERLSQLSQKVAVARSDPARAAGEVRQGIADLSAQARQQLPQAVERIQPEASATAWITFAALAISLLASVAGSMLGRREAAQRLTRQEILP